MNKQPQKNSFTNHLLLLTVGINNGLIPALVGSTLFVWLHEYGFNLKTIGLYSLAALPFGFAFLISTALEQIAYYFKWLRYKTLLQGAILLIAILITLLPYGIKHWSWLFAICLTINVLTTITGVIAQALQKTLFTDLGIVIAVNTLTVGFRIGILLSGSLTLYLSQYVNWEILYYSFAVFLVILFAAAGIYPYATFDLKTTTNRKVKAWHKLTAAYTNLWQIPNIGLILLLMFCFRAPDNLITHYFNLFYLQAGISKTTIAVGYKFVGLILITLGGFLCIWLIRRYSYLVNLSLALILHLVAYLVIYLAAIFNAIHLWFYVCIGLEELTRGMTMVVFWSYQNYICKRRHVLVQLAIFTGIDNLSGSLLGGLGGSLISWGGYNSFLLMVMGSSLPAFIVIYLLMKKQNSS